MLVSHSSFPRACSRVRPAVLLLASGLAATAAAAERRGDMFTKPSTTLPVLHTSAIIITAARAEDDDDDIEAARPPPSLARTMFYIMSTLCLDTFFLPVIVHDKEWNRCQKAFCVNILISAYSSAPIITNEQRPPENKNALVTLMDVPTQAA